MTNKEVVELMRYSLFQLAEEAEDCGNVFAKVRSISDVLVEALSVEGSAFAKNALLNVAYILREYSDIAERKINALEKDLRGAFDRKVQRSNY